MHTNRLLMLADELDRLAALPEEPEFKFNMRDWLHQRQDKIDAGMPKPVEINCAAQGCAFGVAVLMKAFQEMGLTCSHKYGSDAPEMVPVYQGSHGYSAAEKFFNFNTLQAEELFDPDRYPHYQRDGAQAMEAVSKRIRNMVATHLASHKELVAGLTPDVNSGV